MKRRHFLAIAAAAGASRAAGPRLPVRKALYAGMLPAHLPYADRFKLARAAGFEAVECATAATEQEAAEIRQASAAAGLPVHSVMNQTHWKFPLSDPDPKVVGEGLKGLETSLRQARLWGADTVLLVPAVVNAATGYRDAWRRSQENIRKMLPLARELKVVIALENVWNKFLLSPLEFAAYVDSFKSPWVRAYLDVGNMVLFGYPQDWIRTLGARIVKLHLKDFRFQKNVAVWTPLREGEIQWPEVYRALAGIGFRGTATCELPAGDEAYLREVSRRVDLILSGE